MRYLLLVLLLTGCGIQYEYKVTCDSGFDSGWYGFAYVHDAEVGYSNKGEYTKHRKMLDGETCQKHRRITK